MVLYCALAVLSLAITIQSAVPECRAWQECRQLAEDAAVRQDFEAFHDLAWRAVQAGPKNDPALMYLLARAQSLSGRPGDALVMLQRMIGIGAAPDVSTDDFRRVRALPQWESRLNAEGAGRTAPDATSGGRADSRGTAVRGPKGTAGAEIAAPSRAAPAGASSAAPRGGDESLRFTTEPFTPAGLAYDAVSRRFVVGDRYARKLAVVDEFSHHVANLAGAETSGFGDIAALEIDPREGNLWVVSSDGARTTLHKLQLISGRRLSSYQVPEGLAPATFSDVAVAPGGTVLALDTAGHRVFRLRARAGATELAVTLPDSTPASIAPVDDAVAYVGHATGIWRVDLGARSTSPVRAGGRTNLAGLVRIRWHHGSLIGIQKDADGACRAVRIRLDDSGRTATSVDVLDPRLDTTDPTGATVAGGTLYYLSRGEGPEMVVKKIVLR